MKFAHTLILNSVPDWIDQYVDYDHLKKLIYQIERQRVQQELARRYSRSPSTEEGVYGEEIAMGEVYTSSNRNIPPMTVGPSEYVPNDDDERLIKECNIQLDKICRFFESKEAEVLQEAATLRKQFDTFGIPLPNKANRDIISTYPSSEHKLEKLDSLLAGQEDPQLLLTEDEEERSRRSSIESDHTVLSRLRRRQTIGEVIPIPSRGPDAEAGPVRRWRTTDTEVIDQSPFEWMTTPAPLRDFAFLRKRRAKSSVATMNLAGNVDEFNKYYNFRARCTDIYILLSEIKSYVQINQEAFHKILKKWDKVANAKLQSTYGKSVIDKAHPFQPARLREIDTAMSLILEMYAAVFTGGDTTNASSELKLHMRERIQFERNTVWKDLVSKEREIFDAHAVQEVPGYTVPRINFFISKANVWRVTTFLGALVLFICLLSFDTLENSPASKCLALLAFSAVLWAFETIPLFATAYLIPLLIVPMGIVLDEDGNRLGAKDASRHVFQSMFSGTIMVLLGGFAIAAALSKQGVAKAFAAVVLSRAGSRPRWVILVNMYLAAFLCMWISNVATPVLCFSLVQPTLRTLPPNSTVGPALILGIALASCIGGLSSPISSPQNIIAIQILNPSPGWGIWFACAIPLTIFCILSTWGILLLYFRPEKTTPRINIIKTSGLARPSYAQIWVCVVSLVTIILWCTEQQDEYFWGDSGIIAAIPFVLLFGTNMLGKTDLNNFLWSVVVIAQGGMALGYAVQTSGLLDIIGHRLAESIGGFPVLAILFIFGILSLVFATFVSHTVAALIILPIVQQVGLQLHPSEPNLLVMGTVLTTSIAMGLPVSGFPNMNAIMQEDGTGTPYLRMKDFVLAGIPSSLISMVIVTLLGYGILSGLGYN
ncbi:SPX domain-containing protein [Dichotomocladium elegans]|nr:SPX domain-containing protein [Dichotomocladium elegans]